MRISQVIVPADKLFKLFIEDVGARQFLYEAEVVTVHTIPDGAVCFVIEDSSQDHHKSGTLIPIREWKEER